MALPAIAAVRRRFAAARLIVASRSSVASLFQLVPGVDEVVVLQWRGRVLKKRALHADRDSVRLACEPGRAVAVLLPNSFATAGLASRLRFAERWGYATEWRPR